MKLTTVGQFGFHDRCTFSVIVQEDVVWFDILLAMQISQGSLYKIECKCLLTRVDNPVCVQRFQRGKNVTGNSFDVPSRYWRLITSRSQRIFMQVLQYQAMRIFCVVDKLSDTSMTLKLLQDSLLALKAVLRGALKHNIIVGGTAACVLSRQRRQMAFGIEDVHKKAPTLRPRPDHVAFG